MIYYTLIEGTCPEEYCKGPMVRTSLDGSAMCYRMCDRDNEGRLHHWIVLQMEARERAREWESLGGFIAREWRQAVQGRNLFRV